MFQPLLFALTLLASSLFLNVSAAPSAPILSKRAPANVITKCKVNGTIALTFVSHTQMYPQRLIKPRSRMMVRRYTRSCCPFTEIFESDATSRDAVVAELKKFDAKATFFVSKSPSPCKQRTLVDHTQTRWQ